MKICDSPEVLGQVAKVILGHTVQTPLSWKSMYLQEHYITWSCLFLL